NARFLELSFRPGFDSFFTKLRQCRSLFPLPYSDLSLGQSRAVSGFYLSRNLRITLLCAFLNMLGIENEVIPVDSTPFENGHGSPLPADGEFRVPKNASY